MEITWRKQDVEEAAAAQTDDDENDDIPDVVEEQHSSSLVPCSALAAIGEQCRMDFPLTLARISKALEGC